MRYDFQGLALLLASGIVLAQGVLQSDAELQPTTYTDDNGYYGCDVRAIVLAPESLPILGVDFSVGYWIAGRAHRLVAVLAEG